LRARVERREDRGERRPKAGLESRDLEARAREDRPKRWLEIWSGGLEASRREDRGGRSEGKRARVLEIRRQKQSLTV